MTSLARIGLTAPARALSRLLWLLAVLSAPAVAALDPSNTRFRGFDQEQGLSQSTALALAQDRHGMVWIGTQDGLNRFDGYDFRVFRPDASRPGSLSNNWVGALAVDAAGVLWIGTQAGLNRFEPEAEAFSVFRHDPVDSTSLAGDSVHALLVDRAGRLWVGSEGGLSRWDPIRAAFDSFALPVTADAADPAAAVDDRRVRALAEDSSGALWVGGVHGLWRFDPIEARFDAAPAGAPNAGSAIHALAVDGRGRLWVGSDGLGLALLDPSLGRWSVPTDALNTGQVRSLLVHSDGVVWAGTETSLDRITPTADGGFEFSRFVHQRHNPNALARGRVMSLLEDREGTLWIGTWEGGVSRLNAFNNRFVSYGPDVPATAALRSPGIAALAEQNGQLWLGGADALYRFDPAAAQLQQMPAPQDEFIYALDPRPEGLWLATRDGLRIVDADGAMRLAPLPDELAKVRSRRFLVDADRAWVAADTLGLYVVDLPSRAVLAFHPLASVATFVSVFDEHTMIVGAHDGLHWFSRDGGRLLHRHGVATPADATQLPAGPSELLHAADGRRWLATYGGGLLELQATEGGGPQDVRFELVSGEAELGSASLNAMLEDADGRLWISINGRIARFDPRDRSVRRFDSADGVLGRYWIGARARLASGQMAFSGPDGLTMFDPRDVGNAPPTPTPILTSLELDNRPAELAAVVAGSPLQRPLHLLDQLRLAPARSRNLSIRFSAPEYIAPEQLRFSYQLEGFDQDWIETGSRRRFATYTNLPHGDYRFRVRVRNAEGVLSPNEAQLAIIITPFWWETWWAALAAVVVCIGLIAGGFVLRIRQLGQRQRVLKQQVEARTADLQQALHQLTVSERLAAAGQLTAGIAHEINNPANYVQVASQNLQQRLLAFHAFLLQLGGDDLDAEVAAAISDRVGDMREQLDTVLEGSRRIGHIVQELRVFSRLDEAERKPVPVDESLRAALMLLDSRLRSGIELVESIQPLPTLYCQPARLSQAFMCLLQNAAQAIETRRREAGPDYRGRLEVSARIAAG